MGEKRYFYWLKWLKFGERVAALIKKILDLFD